jgi:transposase
MQDSMDYNKLRASASDKVVKSDADRFAAMYAVNPNMKKTEAAKLLKVSRSQIYNWVREIEKANKQ